MKDLLLSPLSLRIAGSLLHFLWQGALLGLLAWAVLRMLQRRSARTRYAVACIFLCACMASVLATYRVLSPAPKGTTNILVLAEPSRTLPIPMEQLGASGALPVPSMTLQLRPLLPWIVPCWLVGMFLCSLRAAGGWFWLQRLRDGSAVVAEGCWQERFAILARSQGIRRVVRLLESPRISSPLSMGLLRPMVMLPLGFFAHLDPLAAEAVLAHELAHIRRLDALVNGLQCVIEILLFFHPAVWWISRRVRTERECCCDDEAVMACGDAVLYVETLSRLDALRERPLALAQAARGGNLMERIKRLLAMNPTPLRLAWPSLVLVGILALGTTVLIARQIQSAPVKPGNLAVITQEQAIKEIGALYAKRDSEPLAHVLKLAKTQTNNLSALVSIARWCAITGHHDGLLADIADQAILTPDRGAEFVQIASLSLRHLTDSSRFLKLAGQAVAADSPEKLQTLRHRIEELEKIAPYRSAEEAIQAVAARLPRIGSAQIGSIKDPKNDRSPFLLQAESLHEAILKFAEARNLDAVIGSGIPDRRGAFIFRHAPWREALESLLKAHGLACVVQDGVLRVAYWSEIQNEAERARQMAMSSEIPTPHPAPTSTPGAKPPVAATSITYLPPRQVKFTLRSGKDGAGKLRIEARRVSREELLEALRKIEHLAKSGLDGERPLQGEWSLPPMKDEAAHELHTFELDGVSTQSVRELYK